MYEFHRITIRSLAKTVAFLSFALYIICGAAITIFYWLLGFFFSPEPLGVKVSALSFLLVWFAGGAAILVAGYILGAVAAFVYNRTARWWGGVQVELTKPEQKQ